MRLGRLLGAGMRLGVGLHGLDWCVRRYKILCGLLLGGCVLLSFLSVAVALPSHVTVGG